MSKGSIGKLVLAGIIGGAIAFGGNAVYEHTQGQNATTNNGTSGTTQVSKVSVDVSSDTTKAISKVSGAIVSVLNYQKSSSSDSDYSSIFGNDGSSSSTTELSSEGSGVIYKKSGNTAYVVTNYHVIAGNSSLEVKLASGKKATATVVGYDEYTDLAVLKISATNVTTVATFGDSSSLTVGEPAIAVGSPLGSTFANTATEGIVSAKSRQVTMTQDDGTTTNINAIQTDASINPGNSGGALINIEGQVIGITQSKLTTTEDGSTSVEGMGFAIPANEVVTVINKLEENGKIVRPALGITMYDLSNFTSSQLSSLKLPSSVTAGVIVRSVQSGMPAAAAGLKEGDVIVKIGDTKITATTDLQIALYKYSVGDTATITYYRDGKKATASVKLNKTSSDLQTTTNSSSDSGN